MIPVGLILVSASASSGTYDVVTGIWNVGPVAYPGNATLSINATVTGTAPVANTATKTAEVQPDLVAGNDSASATVTGQALIRPAADIAITKTVDNPTPDLGSNVTFTITATNYGPSNAAGVQVTDLLPAGLTLVSATASTGTYDSVTGLWNTGPLANLGSATLSVIANVTGNTAVTNTATKTAEVQPDLVPSNDSASATVTGQGPEPALPGLPNTSAPDINAGGPGPNAPEENPGLVLAIVAMLAGLGVVALAGIGQRRNRASAGQRRSRRRRRQDPGGLAIGLLAVVLSLTISLSSLGELAPNPSPPGAALTPVTQLIGTKMVLVVPPASPQAETFHHVAGPITPSRLSIPSIGVDTSIDTVGLRADGSMDAPDNLWTSSWLASSPRPGQAGNAVIAGHRGIGSPALFSHLENLRAGDRIYVSDPAGNELIYVVTSVASLDLSMSTQIAVFGPSSGHHLVLITCFGRYIASARTYDHRIVVFSKLLPLIN
jgi:LPXTG-site transpeptidase (sortase) family protein